MIATKAARNFLVKNMLAHVYNGLTDGVLMVFTPKKIGKVMKVKPFQEEIGRLGWGIEPTSFEFRGKRVAIVSRRRLVTLQVVLIELSSVNSYFYFLCFSVSPT